MVLASPPRLPYVDCVQVSAEEFHLSWSLPTPVASEMKVVIEVAEENGDLRHVTMAGAKLKYVHNGINPY